MEKRRLLQELASRLRKTRNALRISQKDLAAKCGYTRPTYVKNELGQTFPGTMVYYTLGDTFGISLDWLICSKGSMFYREEEAEAKVEVPAEKPVETNREPLPVEIEKLVADMEKVPLLRHEILAFYLRYKLKNRELFDPSAVLQEEEV